MQEDRETDGEAIDDAEAAERAIPVPAETDPAAEEADAAGAEAGAIGGPAHETDADEAFRPLEEAGQGEAEGFELAERDLQEQATHGDGGGDPLRDAGAVEAERSGQEHGEADTVENAD